MLSWMKFCARLISKFLFELPPSFVRGMSWALAILWFDILRIRRKIILENLEIAFPHQTKTWKIKIGRESVYFQAKILFELLYLSRIDSPWIQKNVVFEGEENLQSALAQNKGVCGLSLHLRNGDLGANMIAARGYPILIITKFFKNKVFNDFWFYLRGPKGVGYIEPHGRQAAFDILKNLKKNKIVIFVLDQFMGKPFGVEATFFGRRTGTAYGLAVFYLKTRAPIVPIYANEENDHVLKINFGKALDLDRFISEDHEKTLADLTQYFTSVIENIVTAHPGQWMWLHRRWKTFE